MTDLAKLVVKLEAQTADYQRKLEKAQRQNESFSQKAKRNFGSARAAYIGFAAAVGGAFATIAKGLERQADLFDLSTRLGATTRGLSQLQYAAEQSGVSVQTLNMGLQRMVRRVAEAANGTGEARGALEELNLSASDLKALKPEQQFQVLADAIMGVEDPADRVRLAMKLFDSEGVALIQTMQGGSEALQAFAAESDRLGTTVDDGAAQAAKRASDAFTRLSGVFVGASNALAGKFAPEIEAVANFMAEQLPKAGDFVRKAFITIQRGAVNLTLALLQVRIKWNELTRDFEEADRLKASADILRQMVADLGAQAAMVGRVDTSLSQYRDGLDKTSYSLDQFRQASSSAADAISDTADEAKKAADEIPAFWQEAQESFEVAESMLSKPVDESTSVMDKFFGEDSLKNLFSDFENIEDRFKQLLANMLAEALATQISQAIFGGGGGGGGIGSFVSSLFGGARADGGPVSAGSMYLVGERGPELLVPNVSGNIVPNEALGGATVNMTVVAKDADSFMRSRGQIESEMAKGLRRAGRNI